MMNNNGEMRQSRPCLWAFTLMALAAVLLLANRETPAQTPAPTPWVQNGNNINNTNTGNVGVGTATPNQKLGVQGMFGLYPQPWVSPNVRGMFMFHSGAGGSIYAFNYPGGTGDPIGFSASAFGFHTYIGGTSYTRLTLDNAGNLGIGTTTPAVRLHVAGGTRVDGTHGRLYLGTSAVQNYGGLEFVGETPTIFSIRHHDPNVAWQHLALNPHGGNVGVGTGAVNPAYKLDVAGYIRSSSGGFIFPDGTVQTTAVSSDGGSASVSPWTTTGPNIHFTSGNVGIGAGITAPGEALMVNGKISVNRGPSPGPAELRIYNGGQIAEWAFRQSSSTSHNLNISKAASGVYTDYFTINTSGNVGIGTTSPAYKLDVLESRTNTFAARFLQSNATASNGLFIQTQTASQEDLALHVLTNAGATVALSVRNTGNVGIGTSTPAHKLDVAGSVRSSSGGFVFPDGTIQTTASTGTGGSASTIAAGNVSAGQFGASTGGGTYSFSGHLGIGTASPATKLDVAGSMHVAGICGGGVPNVQGAYMSWNQKACGGGEVDFINHQGGGAGGFWFANTANGTTLSSLMFISGNGNVGIGTDAPAAKLDVTGNVNVTGTITGGSIEAKYQDLAEWVPARGELPSGTVVVLDPSQSNRVMASSSSYDTGVAGVVSAEPGIILGEAGEGKVKVATTGRVKVKVDATRAPIRIGDLLVTSDVEGVAMKSEPVVVGSRRMHSPGTIIGKALESFEKGLGEILVLLSMQ